MGPKDPDSGSPWVISRVALGIGEPPIRSAKPRAPIQLGTSCRRRDPTAPFRLVGALRWSRGSEVSTTKARDVSTDPMLGIYSTEPGIVVCRARYAAASARRATSSFERIDET
jgi:hypothetical protein